MRNESRCFPVGLALTASLLAGCSYSTLEIKQVPNPVMLGPVDRIGGGQPAVAERTVGTVEREISDFVVVSKTDRTEGNIRYTETETTRLSTFSPAAAADVLRATEGRGDRTVRVDGVPAGTYVFAVYPISFAMADRWVTLRGRVTEVRRGP
jgi:hypothetical protein